MTDAGTLERIEAIAAPPRSLARLGYSPDWDAVENVLGLGLPTDFKALASRFGTGEFCDVVDLAAPRCDDEPDPGTSDLASFISTTLDMLRAAASAAPIAVWPEPYGLVPAMNVSTGGWLMWVADGPDPDRWGVVEIEEDLQPVPIGSSLTSVLERWLAGELTDSLLGDATPSYPPFFEPATGRRSLRATIPLDRFTGAPHQRADPIEAALGTDLRWRYQRTSGDRWTAVAYLIAEDQIIRFGSMPSVLSVRAKVVPDEYASFERVVIHLADAFGVDSSVIEVGPERP